MKPYSFVASTPRARTLAVRVVLILTLIPMLLGAFVTPALADGPGNPEPAPGRVPLLRCRVIHEVYKGETLGLIARWYGVTTDAVREANPWLRNRRLRTGDILCIPKPRITFVNPDVEFHAFIQFNRLTVWGSDFPQWEQYYINIREGRSSDPWTRLGSVRSTKKGEILEYFRIPNDLRDLRYYDVCIKEVRRGYTACVRLDRGYQPRKNDFGQYWREPAKE